MSIGARLDEVDSHVPGGRRRRARLPCVTEQGVGYMQDVQPGHAVRVFDGQRWEASMVESFPEVGFVLVAGTPTRAGPFAVPLRPECIQRAYRV